MADYRNMERQLTQSLKLSRRPVAVMFREVPPPGVAKFTGSEPAGCSFWRLASGGKTFYTVPGDHYNCAIGAYTHNITLPPERAKELDQTLEFMIGLGYVRMEEVPGIPRLPKTPGAIVYGPLGDAQQDPDVVLFIGQPGSVMLLQEAALRSGVAAQLNTLARPTCMALPAALGMGTVASTACVGNRVYTDLGDSEMYVAVPGKDLARVVSEAQTIAAANAQLASYHREKRQRLATE